MIVLEKRHVEKGLVGKYTIIYVLIPYQKKLMFFLWYIKIQDRNCVWSCEPVMMDYKKYWKDLSVWVL